MTKPLYHHDGTGILIQIPGVGVMSCYGTTKPTDGADGYAPGCLFHHTDGGAGTALYVNEGTISSCDFNAVAGA